MKQIFIALTALIFPLSVLAKPLNVLFIIADDLGWRDLGCYGSTFYETPHLDALAKSGTQFTSAYAACPVCSPTRSAILTGQYPARTQNTDYFGAPQPDEAKKLPRFRDRAVLPAPYIAKLEAKHTTLPEALKAKGYATFFAGKWHLGPEGSWPEDHGFDINKGGHTLGAPYGGNKYFSPYGNPRLSDGPDGEHLPDRLATETIQFMREHKDKPFLAYLSFYSVHTPLIGRDDLVKKYQKKRADLGLKTSFGTETLTKIRLTQDHAVYAAMVEAMDLAIGRVLKSLEDNGLADNTLVIFTSDNGGLSTAEGWPTSNVPLRAGKGWLYEGGIRVPLLVKWPSVTPSGSSTTYPVTSTDFFPTILDAAGLPLQPANHIDGKSFTSALKKTTTPSPDRALFWHYPHWGNNGGTPSSALRLGDWKLIHYHVPHRKTQLFNLANDLGEKTNLAEKNPQKLNELLKILEANLKATNAHMPTPNSRAITPPLKVD